jgi:hypothetical protein
MSTVPYIFANSSGNIPLSELDANFSNVKASVDSAFVVANAAQPAITSVGTLTGLSVNGVVVVDTGPIKTNGSINMLSGGSSNSTQLQWAANVSSPGAGENQYFRLDTNGAQIRTSSSNYTWQFSTNGNTSFPANVAVNGNVSVDDNLTVSGSETVTGNLTVAGLVKVGSYVKATLNTITGTAGSMAAVLDSPVRQGRIAYWDLTFNRWSYIDDNGFV